MHVLWVKHRKVYDIQIRPVDLYANQVVHGHLDNAGALRVLI